MRIGIYGGTFDPVHYGHLLLAESCRDQCALDEVRFVPASIPPHKQGAEISSGSQRAEMLEFATAGVPEFVVDRMELTRSGPSYTVDTLQQIHDADPTHDLFFLMGADSLRDLPTWRQPERIAELATVVAVNRGDRPLPQQSALAEDLAPSIVDRIQFVTMPGIDLAASDIRERVRREQSIRFMVPRAVEQFIQEHAVYQNVS